MTEEAIERTKPIKRAPRVLWANAFCILDKSSGASLHVFEMLKALHSRGCDVRVLGATIFDAPSGMVGLEPDKERILSNKPGSVVRIRRENMLLDLVVTRSTQRVLMTEAEQTVWMAHFKKLIREFRPDAVFFYGGQALDSWATQITRARGIPVIAFLANGNYHGIDWCYNVDLIVTDSYATSRLYKERLGLDVIPVGAFIDPSTVVSAVHRRTHVTFVNPAPEKGGAIVAAIAANLEERRPDIPFDVIETRAKWEAMVRHVTRQAGDERAELSNVRVRPAMQDMRSVYADTKVLLAPSLWHESGGRVVVEALLNGLPVIVSNSGGLPDFAGNNAIVVDFGSDFRKPPYLRVPDAEQIEKLSKVVERFFDDALFYESRVGDSIQSARKAHSLEQNTDRLLKAILPLLRRAAGDFDHLNEVKKNHLQFCFYDNKKTASSLQEIAVRHDDFRRLSGPSRMNRAPVPPHVRSLLYSGFVGGAASMGRVGLEFLKHVVRNEKYKVHFRPFPNDNERKNWPDWVRDLVVGDDLPKEIYDQQIKFCSVLEARQKRLSHRVTPWFFHDVDGLPREICTAINSNDEVFVVSNFVRGIFEKHSVTVPIKVMGHGFDPQVYQYRDRTLEGPFEFLCIAENTPRKNLGNLCRAFNKAFGTCSDVRLRIKTGPAHSPASLRALVGNSSNIILDTVIRKSERELAELYYNADCFVLASHIEAFGMPVLEAMATGLPAIVTAYGGQLDFCTRENSFLIEVESFEEVDRSCFPHLPGSWAIPSMDHLVNLMRLVVNNYEDTRAVGKRAHQDVHVHWTWSEQLGRYF